jgi:hypothetical protein
MALPPMLPETTSPTTEAASNQWKSRVGKSQMRTLCVCTLGAVGLSASVAGMVNHLNFTGHSQTKALRHQFS